MAQTKAQLVDYGTAVASSVPTNGPYLSAANTVAISTNGAQRVTVDSSGRCLVGTSTSNAPGSLNSKLQVEALDFTGSYSAVRNSVDTGGPQLVLGKSRGTSLGAKTIVASGDSLGSINFFGADGTNFIEGASVGAFVDGTPGANDMPGRLVFSVCRDGQASPSEAARIINNGNVCIGRTDTNSGARLNVRSAQTDYTGFAFSVQNGNQSELFAAANDGNIYAGAISTSTGTALVLTSGGYIVKSSSSIRYKENVEPIDIGLDFVMGLSPVKYNLKQSGEAQVGFIAEDFPEPRLVSQSQVDPSDPSKGLQVESVNYQNLVAPLVKAIQEQQAMIAELQAEVAALKAA